LGDKILEEEILKRIDEMEIIAENKRIRKVIIKEFKGISNENFMMMNFRKNSYFHLKKSQTDSCLIIKDKKETEYKIALGNIMDKELFIKILDIFTEIKKQMKEDVKNKITIPIIPNYMDIHNERYGREKIKFGYFINKMLEGDDWYNKTIPTKIGEELSKIFPKLSTWNKQVFVQYATDNTKYDISGFIQHFVWQISDIELPVESISLNVSDLEKKLGLALIIKLINTEYGFCIKMAAM